MPVTETDLVEIQARIGPLLGEKVRGARLGRWNSVTFELGGLPDGDGLSEQPHAGWRLRLTASCSWRLEQGPEFIAGDCDRPAMCRRALERMLGRALRSVVLTPPALETEFVFDDEMVLYVFPLRSEHFGPWALYAPHGKVLTIGPGSSWRWVGARRR